MAVWIAVLAVGAASLLFRLVPFLAVERSGPVLRRADALRHAGSGALTALVVLAVLGGTGGGTPVAVPVAVAVAAVLAWSGRSLVWVMAAGGAAYAVVLLLAGG